jgi:diaminohydroxyphosphoribosylaminopyrimidine deaminase / 5-amino-6-(5-phosphoribosylamino)uracil reductase
MADPFPAVGGRGLAALRQAGVEVECGLLEPEARRLNAPYLKLVGTGRPWLIGKWAMTLDGKIATSAGESQWISGDAARQVVHQLRGRVDGILVGSGTAAADDPLLTARPPGPRVATRIVVDSQARLSPTSQLARTAREIPVLVATSQAAPPDHCATLAAAGCEMLKLPGEHPERLLALLDELGRRRLTNVLVEGGSGLLGSLVDAGQLDEVHVFVAPKIVGGRTALSPVGGRGIRSLAAALKLDDLQAEPCGADWHLHGRVKVAGTGFAESGE